MKRILSLDGGGIRGVFTLELLLEMQTLLREHYQNPKLVLRDHFDCFAGTSTGAIIATCLCWGMEVEDVLKLYTEVGGKMFQPLPWYQFVRKFLVTKFTAEPLTEILKNLFLDDETGQPALLSSSRIKDKLLLVVVRNHTTGSAWPLTNNPLAKYNKLDRPDCNMKIPLWELVRASTAAPTFFPPAEIMLGDTKQIFVDGSITPYSNPAVIAALTATLPAYHVDWPTGPEKIRLVSVGTIQFSSELPGSNPKLWVGYYAKQIPTALLQTMGWQQDYICRCLGTCLYGEPLDGEIGDLIGVPNIFLHSWFSYVRYNQTYKKKEMEEILLRHPHLAEIDAIDAIPILSQVGKEYAAKHIKIEHLI